MRAEMVLMRLCALSRLCVLFHRLESNRLVVGSIAAYFSIMAVQSQSVSRPATTWPAEPMSYEEFLAAVDEDTHAEWVNGRIEFMSPVSLAHDEVSLLLLKMISYQVDVRHSGRVCREPFQMKTGPDLPGRSPDIFFVAKDNLRRLKKHYLDGPADVVVEIISPESRARDRGE